jgi:hypothetical protein
MGAAEDFRSFLVSSLLSSTIFDILGSPTPTNQIVYAAWPQTQPVLSTSTDEPPRGWMAFRIDDFVRKQDILQFKSVFLDVWATQPLLLEQVKDVTNDLFDLKLAGQNGLAVSSFNITYSQLARSTDLYEEDIHLYRRQTVYEFRLVKR